MVMFERPENVYPESALENHQIYVTPPENITAKDGRPDDAWVQEQEILLNQRYPGRSLLLEYHSLDNKMHVTENKSDTSEAYPTKPLDEWLIKNSK
jgi:hypothetical protein